jgi:hypothetical protein
MWLFVIDDDARGRFSIPVDVYQIISSGSEGSASELSDEHEFMIGYEQALKDLLFDFQGVETSMGNRRGVSVALGQPKCGSVFLGGAFPKT